MHTEEPAMQGKGSLSAGMRKFFGIRLWPEVLLQNGRCWCALTFRVPPAADKSEVFHLLGKMGRHRELAVCEEEGVLFCW